MYKRILVPLDGSYLSEQALLPAISLAEKYGSELWLLRIVPVEPSLPALPQFLGQPNPQPPETDRPWMVEAESYLWCLPLPGAQGPVKRLVLSGAPADLICAIAAEQSVDLIVMSTHGRSGLLRLLYGSVAEAVLRGARVPVLLIPSRAVARVAVQPEADEYRRSYCVAL